MLADQIAGTDAMRARCPVAHSEYLQWSLFRHRDVERVLGDPAVFSNAVSSHLSVPNGFDPPEHTAYRRLIDPYFSSERMAEFEPACRGVAVELISGLRRACEVEFTSEFADLFAIRAQCAFLDWPSRLHGPLLEWTRKNHAAVLSGDRDAQAAVAVEFDGTIRGLINERSGQDRATQEDAVARLLQERIDGRPLREEEIVSILRNWTVGELSTISACVGILAHFLAARPEVQLQLRAEPALLPAAIEEILRIHGPLITSRRITTQETEVAGLRLSPGARVTLMWASANRDEREFGDPDEFRLDRDPAKNLLYGAGIHACPGAPLARLELRVILEELLKRTRSIALASGKEPVRAVYPAGGFTALPLLFE
ncbi:MAG: cytochrome P450 [Candidatus Acidiferrales bacterium]